MTKRRLVFFGKLLLILLCAVPFEAQSPRSEGEELIVKGRVVLFDWQANQWEAVEDFVVYVVEPKSPGRSYIRVVYPASESHEVPQRTAPRLPRNVFVGRGRAWQFALRDPKTPFEKGSCDRIDMDTPHELEDEMGKIRIARYLPTPGAEALTIPPIGDLPCYALMPGGLAPVPK
jgi:hypothetical protein